MGEVAGLVSEEAWYPGRDPLGVGLVEGMSPNVSCLLAQSPTPDVLGDFC